MPAMNRILPSLLVALTEMVSRDKATPGKTPSGRPILRVFVLLALLWVFSAHPAFANACAWVSGSTKNWSDTTAWTSCGSVAPTAADTVTVSGTGTLTIDGTSGSPSLARAVDFTGFTGTVSLGVGKQWNIGGSVAGAFKLVSGMTFAPAGVLKFVSTVTGNNITVAGKAMCQAIFDGVGGGWVLQDTWSGPGSGTAGGITLTNGTLDTNGQALTDGTTTFSSNNSNTRALTLGATSWSIPDTGVAIPWDIGTSTGMTLSAASSTINLQASTHSSTFAGGGLTYGTVSSTSLQTATTTITGANTFGTLTLSASNTAKTTTSGYALSANQTVTGTFTAAGNSTILRNFIYSDTLGTPRTITAATATVTHTDFRDITGAGAATWNFSALTSTADGDCGGNSGITFTAPKNAFMKTAVSVNWSGSNWFTASGGSTAIVPAMPLCQDTAKFDVNSVTAASKTITLDEPRAPSMDWTGVANTPAFASGSNIWEEYGSITLVSGMTHTGTGSVTLMGRSSYSIDGGTLTWPASSGITVQGPGGTYSLSRNFTSSAGLNVTAGTFNGAFTGSFTTGTVNGGTYTPGGTASFSGAFAVSSGVLNLAQQINGSSTITVSGGTINDTGSACELKGTTASFTGGTSAIRKMTLSSTFAISSAASLTFDPGTFTWATTWTETGSSFTETFNGKASKSAGTLTVTAAPVINRGMNGGFQ